MAEELTQFTPDDASRDKYRAIAQKIMIKHIDEFFELWESLGENRTDAPREAGTMVAHALIEAGARIAVFGTQCAGREPVREQWHAVCDEHFDKALADVAQAFVDVPDEG